MPTMRPRHPTARSCTRSRSPPTSSTAWSISRANCSSHSLSSRSPWLARRQPPRFGAQSRPAQSHQQGTATHRHVDAHGADPFHLPQNAAARARHLRRAGQEHPAGTSRARTPRSIAPSSRKSADPLMHMVRNAIDHAIEPPEQRTAAGQARDRHDSPARLSQERQHYHRGDRRRRRA